MRKKKKQAFPPVSRIYLKNSHDFSLPYDELDSIHTYHSIWGLLLFIGMPINPAPSTLYNNELAS